MLVLSGLHSRHVLNLDNKADFSTPLLARVVGGAPKEAT